ncbi:MAG: 4-(cytidine 5'-diphospho)-2-C-methyl-D-erythritol kinase [Bacilli bacterium]|nr:4-(cytidine 5'-diphospho)-2-C-methyl-D-erythritol kinase [Bacilli bacterium]
MIVKAYAKINVYLDVISKRDDGYHELVMVMLPLELHDTIEIESVFGLRDSYVTCDHVELQETKYNLINTTISKLRELYHFKQNYNIKVHKEIPISAGLGGGSSNAAATLRAFNQMLKLKIGKDELNEIGKTIGADVPFCLYNKPALVKGIGEELTPIKLKHQYYVLIIKPERGLSTKRVFEKADTLELDHGDVDAVVSALEKGDDDKLAESMFNSLEKASLQMVPEIQDVKDMLRKDGLKMVMMSGSGSAVYALSTDHNMMKALYRKYEKKGLEVYLTKTLIEK